MILNQKLHPNKGYQDWKQVGGYFDGDGNVNVKIQKFTLLFRLDFSDSFERQVIQLSQFLRKHDISHPSIQKYYPRKGRPSYSLRVDRIKDVLSVAKSMLPFAFKKSMELRLCIAYLEDRITGKNCVGQLNRLVEAGIRSGENRDGSHIQFTHKKGVHTAQMKAAKAAIASNSVLTDEERREIRREYAVKRRTSPELAAKYGVTKSTILRVLRQHKRSE